MACLYCHLTSTSGASMLLPTCCSSSSSSSACNHGFWPPEKALHCQEFQQCKTWLGLGPCSSADPDGALHLAVKDSSQLGLFEVRECLQRSKGKVRLGKWGQDQGVCYWYWNPASALSPSPTWTTPEPTTSCAHQQLTCSNAGWVHLCPAIGSTGSIIHTTAGLATTLYIA